LEKAIESAALGRIQSQAFELLVPLGLGLSIKWIERWAERIVERILYRNKMRAEHELNALVEDFPHARDVQGLSTRVAREICRQMNASFVCVYRESGLTYSPIAVSGNGESLPVDADDPVFMRLRSKHAVLHTDDFATTLPRHSSVFPLVVFGAVTGALVVQSRELGEAYDPDELDTLKRVAHELAIALLWVERAASPPRAVPAV
jgi:GAF domain